MSREVYAGSNPVGCISSRGGIGRRDRFRICWGIKYPWKFESSREHSRKDKRQWKTITITKTNILKGECAELVSQLAVTQSPSAL